MLPYCVENNISFIPYGPLAFGILGGTYTQTKVEKLKEFAAEKQSTISHLALAWLLAQDGVDAVIPGGKRPEQIRGTRKAVQVVLHEQDLNKIDNI